MFSKGKDHLCLFVCTCVSLLALPASVALKWEKRRIKDLLGVWPRPQFLGWGVLYLTLVSVIQKCVPPPQRRASNKPPDGRQLEQHDLSQSEYVYDCIMESWCHLGRDEWDFISSYRWNRWLALPIGFQMVVYLPYIIDRHQLYSKA